MADSRVPATVLALYNVVKAAPALTSASPPVNVWDGPVVTGDPTDSVFIGYDGDPEGEFASVVGDEEWAGLGAKARDEQFEVVCSIVTLAGDGDIAAARARIYALFAGVTGVLRVDPSLGQAPPFVAAVKSPQLFIDPTPQGLQPRLVFHVAVKTRI